MASFTGLAQSFADSKVFESLCDENRPHPGNRTRPVGPNLGPTWAQLGSNMAQLGHVPMLLPCQIERVHSDDVVPTCKMCKFPQRGTDFWRPVPVEHGHPPQLKLYQSDWSVRILAAKLARLGTFGTGGLLPVFASFACGIWWLATLLLALGWLIGWHHRCHKWLAQGHLKLLTRWRDTKTATVSVCVLIRLDFNTAVSSILAIVGDGAVKGIKIAEHCKNCTIWSTFKFQLRNGEDLGYSTDSQPAFFCTIRRGYAPHFVFGIIL